MHKSSWECKLGLSMTTKLVPLPWSCAICLHMTCLGNTQTPFPVQGLGSELSLVTEHRLWELIFWLRIPALLTRRGAWRRYQGSGLSVLICEMRMKSAPYSRLQSELRGLGFRVCEWGCEVWVGVRPLYTPCSPYSFIAWPLISVSY